MKTLMNLLMTCAVLGMMSTSVMAGGEGGGGAKDDGAIVVKNGEANFVLLVTIGQPSDAKLSTLLAEGAQFVPPNGTASFDVAAGSHEVFAVLVPDALGGTPLNVGTKTVNVGKNQTVNVIATNNAGDTKIN